LLTSGEGIKPRPSNLGTAAAVNYIIYEEERAKVGNNAVSEEIVKIEYANV
jgi:hypothetical protein